MGVFIKIGVSGRVVDFFLFPGIVQQQIRMGVTPEMNAYENFRNQVTYNLIRPQGFVIISSTPNHGVLPLIRKAMGK